MIVVHVPKTWPLVLEGRLSAEDAVFVAWPIAEEKLNRFGDVVLGVYQNTVVAAFDITCHSRRDDKRVAFEGVPSKDWKHLIGQPTPAKPWGEQGDAWPVRFIDTDVVAGGDVPVEETPTGYRAVVGDAVVTLDVDGQVTVTVPAGSSVTVKAA